LRGSEEEDVDDEPPPLEYGPIIEELTECWKILVSVNYDDKRCVRSAATLRAEKMASARFTLGSKKIADLKIGADGAEDAASQQDVEVLGLSPDVPKANSNSNAVSANDRDEHMVYEFLTDTSNDSDESDEAEQDEHMVCESLKETSSDSDDSGGCEIIMLASSSDDESSDDDGNAEGERLSTPVNGAAVSAETLISDPD